MLWHYDCPMVMTVCWSSCFLPSPCPETWSQSLLAHFPISWRIPHYLVFKTFFPPKSPLFSPLHLPGMSLGTRACICLIYFALAQFLAVTKLVSSVTEAKQEEYPLPCDSLMEGYGKDAGENCGRRHPCYQYHGRCHGTVVIA